MGKVKTYLEFGYQDGKKKVPYDTRENQEAYDFFMVSRYLKDIIAYRTGKIENVHHKQDIQDNIKKYTALSICKNLSQPLVYYEIGSSLMGVIDSLEYLNKIFRELLIKNILFVGIDNSDMMNTVASFLYKDYKLELFKEKVIIPCGLFFAKGVSLLYAFKDEELFCNILKNAKLCVFDYTFSLKENLIKDIIGSGKIGTYLSLKKCKELLACKTKQLILQPSKRQFKIPKGRILYECIYGNKELVKQYVEELQKKIFHFQQFIDLKQQPVINSSPIKAD